MSIEPNKTRTVSINNMEAIHFYSFFGKLRTGQFELNKSSISRNVIQLMPIKLIYNPILETVQKEFSDKYAEQIESFQSESNEHIKKTKEVALLNKQHDYFENDTLLKEFSKGYTDVSLQQIHVDFCIDGEVCPTYLLELLMKYNLIDSIE